MTKRIVSSAECFVFGALCCKPLTMRVAVCAFAVPCGWPHLALLPLCAQHCWQCRIKWSIRHVECAGLVHGEQIEQVRCAPAPRACALPLCTSPANLTRARERARAQAFARFFKFAPRLHGMSTSSRIELITSLAARHNAEREAALPVMLFLWIASVPSLQRHATDGLLVALKRINMLSDSITELPDSKELDSTCAPVVQHVLGLADLSFTAEVDVKAAGLKPNDARRVAKLCHLVEMTALFDDLDAAPLQRESCRRHARVACRALVRRQWNAGLSMHATSIALRASRRSWCTACTRQHTAQVRSRALAMCALPAPCSLACPQARVTLPPATSVVRPPRTECARR